MDRVDETRPGQDRMAVERAADDTLLVRLAGKWKTGEELPTADALLRQIESGPSVQRITFDTKELTGWDSNLLTFLVKAADQCALQGIEADREGLPDGVKRLLTLAAAVPEREDAEKSVVHHTLLARIGDETVSFYRSAMEMFGFIGEATQGFIRMLRGKARFRGCDLSLAIQQCGAQALPVVSLIKILVGMILAFVGAVLMSMFGAQVYVATMVGFAMVRVMGSIMTGIIMAGRTGAAFAAQLGTMEVNEEIDALKTMGISPMEFLVLPRMIALALMMPLLYLYACLMGILGGLIVSVGMLDITLMEYYTKTVEGIRFQDFWVGLFQSSVFGVLVALAGCLRGMQCGRCASGVGLAATSAVVTGIVSIVVATAIITVMCYSLGI